MAYRNAAKTLKFPVIVFALATLGHVLYMHYGLYIFTAFSVIWFLRAVRRLLAESVSTKGKAVLITGCDTGFGHDLVRHLSDHTESLVIAGCLDDKSQGAVTLSNLHNVHVIKIDIAEDDLIHRCLKEVTDLLEEKSINGLWGLVNNAGIDYCSPIELSTIKVFKQIADVNIFGTVRITKAFLPLVRAAKGRVVFTSSVRGRMCQSDRSAYSLTKYATECFADTLRREMIQFGVEVCIVEPGNFCSITSVMQNTVERIEKQKAAAISSVPAEVMEAYGTDYYDKLMEVIPKVRGTTCTTTRPVVEALNDALWSGRPHTRYLIPGSNSVLDNYNVMVYMTVLLPDRITDWISNKIA